MDPETRPELEQLFKSIQTFETLQMAADNREKMYRYNDALMQSLYSILEDQEADEQTKLQFLDDTLNQYAAAMKELFPKIIAKPVMKANAEQFDLIEEVEKFNPYHDELGRFSTADRYDQFTITTRDPSKQHWADAAIAREQERDRQGLIPGPKIDPGKLPKPKGKPKDQPKEPPKKDPEEKPAANHPTPAPTNTKTNLPEKMLATCQDIEAKTVNRKTEKMSLVDEEGNVLTEKSGTKGSVRFGGYETAHMGPTVTLTHNHPGDFGGTFSGADVDILTKYDLRAIRAVGKEGTYSLERTNDPVGMKQYTFNKDYAKQSNAVLRGLKSEFKTMQKKVWDGEISSEDANRHLAEYRTSQCNGLHDWLTQNSASYGYNYVFEPSGGVGKMFDVEKEVDEETTGEEMLDGEFISGDNWMIKDTKSDK